MPVPRTIPGPLERCLTALILILAAAPAFTYAKGPEPPLRIPLESIGVQPFSARLIDAGATLTTVNFIDDKHLLLTFSVHALMKRLPEARPDDDDRIIEAVVLQLPTGKVLARTHWRVHDLGQYLWSLGHGRFLLRMRDTLNIIAPLENLAEGEPFAEQPFLKSNRQIAIVELSPDKDLLTVETIERAPATAAAVSSSHTPTQLNFYRIVFKDSTGKILVGQNAGMAAARGLLDLSLTSAGYLETYEEATGRWLFDFDFYTGKTIELSSFDSTCRPHAYFVSASEFVAFGCRGSDGRLDIAGFNLRGEQVWQQDFLDSHAFPSFVTAPEAGRFVLSRNVVLAGSGTTVEFAPPTVTTQELRLYQSSSGKQLLRTDAGPVQRGGQNFDLSADGLQLAVIRNKAIEIYRLPALTKADEAAIRSAQTLRPQDDRAIVDLSTHRKLAVKANTGAFQPLSPTIQAEPIEPADAPPAVTEHRKPPTLYAPGEAPEKKPQ